jgi:hypothetical protein
MPALFALEERKTWIPILEASSIFLFLDFEGTLTEIAPRPGARSELSHVDRAPGEDPIFKACN